MEKAKSLIVILILFLAVPACSPVSQQIVPTLAPTHSIPPTQTPVGLPQTDADVPRVGVVDAKVAFDSGQAVLVDVRSANAFAAGHIAGAISMPLEVIEINPAGVAFDKNQWIITYCT
jgi:hypothetical protein